MRMISIQPIVYSPHQTNINLKHSLYILHHSQKWQLMFNIV